MAIDAEPLRRDDRPLTDSPDLGAWYRPARVHLVEYDDGWPERYRIEASRIAGALGPDLVAIEHVGSTAVPGMPAKPVIDILAAVAPWTAFDAMVSSLRDLGYVYTPESEADDPGRRVFRKGPEDMSQLRTHHLHVTDAGSDYWMRIVAFRDRLRNAPEDAAAYARLKRRLATRFEHDSRGYTAGKSDFVRSRELGPP